MIIDDFEKQFMEGMHIAMARQGRVLDKSAILIIGEFVKNIKTNGLDLAKVKKE